MNPRSIRSASADQYLSDQQVRDFVASALRDAELRGKRVLVIIPDGTRTAPLPLLFRIFHEALADSTGALDFLIALGTHRLMGEERINQLVGITAQERATTYARTRILNHRWDLPETYVTLGRIDSAEVQALSNGLLQDSLDVRINKLVTECDTVVICGPTFPHEVVGFSGGNKYFFPGIGGPEVIDLSHWLGALLTSTAIIGTKDTPVRRLINRAAGLIKVRKLCLSLVVAESKLAGIYFGTPEAAYALAADHSAQVHIRWLDQPVRRALAVIPQMYEDIWTAAKGMYKLDPVIADGGEVVIFAPHISEFSYSHGAVIEEIGYHIRDYFLADWPRFSAYPRGILAHSTHLRGTGSFEHATGTEYPRIAVTLATGISADRCRALNLGYLDPATVDVSAWLGQEAAGVMVVPRAGEVLYRLNER